MSPSQRVNTVVAELRGGRMVPLSRSGDEDCAERLATAVGRLEAAPAGAGWARLSGVIDPVWATPLMSGTPEASAALYVSTGGEPPPRGEGTGATTVLLIDDNPLNRELYEQLLLDAGHLVVSCSTGVEGVRRTAETHPDAVLSDVRLPDMSGFQVAETLRAIPGAETMPILLMSARLDDNSRRRALETGADAFLAAPFDQRDLERELGKRLRPQAGHANSRRGTSPPRISLFGVLTIVVGDQEFSVRDRRLADLLALLALDAPVAVPDRDLLFALWPMSDGESTGPLDDLCERAFDLLEAIGIGDYLVRETNTSRLDLPSHAIDVRAFTDAAHELLSENTSGPPDLVDRADRVLKRWSGEPLRGLGHNEVFESMRQQLWETRALLAEHHALNLLQRNRPREAAETIESLAISEPWREDSWMLLMVALFRAGLGEQAQAAFHNAKDIMRSELGTVPSQRLHACNDRVRAADRSLLTDAFLGEVLEHATPAVA